AWSRTAAWKSSRLRSSEPRNPRERLTPGLLHSRVARAERSETRVARNRNPGYSLAAWPGLSEAKPGLRESATRATPAASEAGKRTAQRRAGTRSRRAIASPVGTRARFAADRPARPRRVARHRRRLHPGS